MNTELFVEDEGLKHIKKTQLPEPILALIAPEKIRSKTSEGALFLRIRTGDHRASNEVILDHLSVVASVVAEFEGLGHEAEDLFQIGVIALYEARDTFKNREGYFRDYAREKIQLKIRKAIIKMKTSARVSREMSQIPKKEHQPSEPTDFAMIYRLLKTLPEQARKMISLRFGLYGKPSLTIEEIDSSLQYHNRTHIQRIIDEGLFALRRGLK